MNENDFEDFDWENDPEQLELNKLWSEIEELDQTIDEMFEFVDFLEFLLATSSQCIEDIEKLRELFLAQNDPFIKGLLFSNLVSLYEGYVNRVIANLLLTKHHQKTLIQRCSSIDKNESCKIKSIKKSINKIVKKNSDSEAIAKYLTDRTLNNHSFVAQLFSLMGIDFDITLKAYEPTSLFIDKVLKIRNSWTHRYGYLENDSKKQIIMTDKTFDTVFRLIHRFILEITNETNSAILNRSQLNREPK